MRRFLSHLFDAHASRVAVAHNNLATHPLYVLARRCAEEAADYIQQRGANAVLFNSNMALLSFALERIGEGLILEFGVDRGASIRHIAAKTSRRVHGFDSFEGLPSAGAGTTWTKGQFNRRGQLPAVPANVSLHKGWFSDTIPPFIAKNPSPVAFAHIDCDLYDSAKEVMMAIADRIRPGTVLVLDDYFNFPGWKQHEYRAFQELTADQNLKYQYIGFARQQAAVVIT